MAVMNNEERDSQPAMAVCFQSTNHALEAAAGKGKDEDQDEEARSVGGWRAQRLDV